MKEEHLYFYWNGGLFYTTKSYSLGQTHTGIYGILCVLFFFLQSRFSDMQHFPGPASEDQVHFSYICNAGCVFVQLGDCSPPQLCTVIPISSMPTAIALTRSQGNPFIHSQRQSFLCSEGHANSSQAFKNVCTCSRQTCHFSV